MAHQMSPPQRPAQRPYSPYGPAHSPTGLTLPPAKRPRLSPDASSPQMMPYSPQSPYTSFGGGGPAASPPSFNTPQPYSSSPPMGAMGPPPRPNADKVEKEEKEKITDISDISDVIFGSGVDLREEENYLNSTFRNVHGQHSFNASFDSGTTVTSRNNGFNLLTKGTYAGHPALAGSGDPSQPADSRDRAEAELERKHQAAALAHAKQHEHHLRDPFLLGNTVRHRMHRLALDQGVTLDIKGLYEPSRVQPRTPSIPETKPHSLLDDSSRYADILSLVSLAANERLRTLLDEAYTIARGRRYGSHAIVPPDLADIATGDGERSAATVPASITGTSWDKPPDGTEGLVANGTAQGSQPTVSFISSLSAHLQNIAISDRNAELARIRKRQERAKRAASASADPDATPTDTPPGPAPTTAVDPATPSADISSQVAPEKPLTKKERERQAKMGQTEEVLHKNANVTAAMALGGRKGKKYSWMSGGAAAAQSNPYSRAPPTPAPASATKGPDGEPRAGSAGPVVEKGMRAKERKWGSWREDRIEGRGIQVRDWVMVLERDGREKKALQKCLLRLDSSDAPQTT